MKFMQHETEEFFYTAEYIILHHYPRDGQTMYKYAGCMTT
jgi:hypothetical protein